MREIRTSGSEGGGAKPIVSPYPYLGPSDAVFRLSRESRRSHVRVRSSLLAECLSPNVTESD
jgi:hypothetical protein